MKLLRLYLLALAAAWSLAVVPAHADQGYPGDGMVVLETEKTFKQLVEDLRASIRAENMLLVTRASASAGARGRGITIPGNMVVGVFRNDYALRMLEASVPAGIEAPVRFYLTEEADGTATLTYRKPSAVFAPYGSEQLDVMARELDIVFSDIARGAVR
ncbi:DUF302 domain-containing protein [Kiloniella sp. b19]|uniref:DUF302 domain-containing protein n=1 Tax=Kiloniella sp. GXU_MW_B19 TaxID=3141326 RepID=UPI0031E2E79B